MMLRRAARPTRRPRQLDGGGAYGWAVYGPGRSLIAGWERTKDKNAAAAYAERAALKAANRRRRR